MHEGRKIKELLDAHRRTISDLARAADVSPQAAQKYVMADRLGAKAWESASRGLIAMGINPREIREVPSTVEVHRARDLRLLLQGMSTQQLQALAEILDASLAEQHILRIVIADRLDRERSG